MSKREELIKQVADEYIEATSNIGAMNEVGDRVRIATFDATKLILLEKLVTAVEKIATVHVETLRAQRGGV